MKDRNKDQFKCADKQSPHISRFLIFCRERLKTWPEEESQLNIVLKIGLDRPVEPETGQVSGLVTPKESLRQKTGIEPAKPAKNQ